MKVRLILKAVSSSLTMKRRPLGDLESGTLPETNIAPEHRPSQKDMSSSNHQFSGAMLVSGRVSLGFEGILEWYLYACTLLSTATLHQLQGKSF